MDFNEEDIIQDYNAYIHSLPSGLEKIIENIDNENYGNVNSQILFLIEGFQWLLSASKFLGENNAVMYIDFAQLNEHLDVLLSSFEKQDYVLMSDIIEYELIPYFGNLKVEN